MALELASEMAKENMGRVLGMSPIAQAPTPFRRRSNCVPDRSNEADRPKEPEAESEEAVLCLRCGVHPVNSRKALRQRGLCCNNCPHHGPWCTMHNAPQAQCCNQKEEAITSRKQAAPPPQKAAEAQRGRRASVGRRPRDAIEVALHKVEVEYDKKIETERKQNEKCKREEDKELAGNQKRLKKRHRIIASRARTPKKKRGKCKESVPESCALEKRGQRSSIHEVLHNLDEVYTIMDEVKTEQDRLQQADDEVRAFEADLAGMPPSPREETEDDDEEAVGSSIAKIRFLHEAQAMDWPATDAETKSKPDDEQTVTAPLPQETEAEKRKRGRAALIRAKILYIEMVREREQEQFFLQKTAKAGAKRSCYQHAAADAEESLRDIARAGSRMCDDDVTPRVKQDQGASDSTRSEYASSRMCDDDETPRVKQDKGALKLKKLPRESPRVCDEGETPRVKQNQGTPALANLLCVSSPSGKRADSASHTGKQSGGASMLFDAVGCSADGRDAPLSLDNSSEIC